MDADILLFRMQMQKMDAVVTWMLTFGFSICKKSNGCSGHMQKMDAVVTWVLTFCVSVCKKLKWMQWSHGC